jgi:hypothetical protein
MLDFLLVVNLLPSSGEGDMSPSVELNTCTVR